LINLKEQFGDRFVVSFDPSAKVPGQSKKDRLWLYRIEGENGYHVYVHSENALGAFARTSESGPDWMGRLLAQPFVKVHQLGDDEVSVVFPHERLDALANILQLRRRRPRLDCPSAAA
jgi:hypothetical protein